MVSRTLSHYRILEELGRGGMGVVYKAEDTKLKRTIALKVLRKERAKSRRRLERFQQEARAVAAINHPNIVTIYSVDEAEGRHFFTMELVSGATLDRVIPDGGFGLDEFLELAAQIAEAISGAHKHGISHRDLKPSNIMITKDSEVKILDFGLAKLWPHESEVGEESPTESLTLDRFIGTPAYASPEQFSGRGVAHQTDIFSLGVILYEIATGQRPFRSEVPSSVLYDRPRPVREIRTDLPPRVGDIIHRCLKKDPRKRWHSASDIVNELHRLRADLHARRLAVLPFRNIGPEPESEYFSDGMTEETIDVLLNRVEGLDVVPLTSTLYFKNRSSEIREVATKLRVGSVLDGSVRRQENRLRVTVRLSSVPDERILWSHTYDREIQDDFAIQNEIAERIAGSLQFALSQQPHERRIDDDAARDAYWQGRFLWNRRYEGGLRKAIESFQEAIRLQPDSAPAYAGLADCLVVLGWYALRRPQEVFPLARKTAQVALELDATLAEAHNSLGAVATLFDWSWAEAEKHFAESIRWNPRYSLCRYWHAYCLMAQGRTEESLKEGRRALKLDPLSLSLQCGFGWLLFLAGKPVEALKHLESVLSLDRSFPLTPIFFGWTYEALGRYDEALQAWRSAEEAWRDEETGSIAASLQLQRAGTLAASGEASEARKLFEAVLANEPETYISPCQKALVQLELGERERALALLEEALEERDSWLLTIKLDPRFKDLIKEDWLSLLVAKIGPGSPAESGEGGSSNGG